MFGTIGTLALVLTMQTAGGQAPASNQQPRDGGRSAPRRLTVTYSDHTHVHGGSALPPATAWAQVGPRSTVMATVQSHG